MPVFGCTLPQGGAGFKFGEGGKCFRERARAVAQGVAITISQQGSSHPEKNKDKLHKHDHFDTAEIQTVEHWDLLKIAKGQMQRTDEGFLQGDAPIAQVGVMSYLMHDGTILKELVGAEALFDQKSMDSLKMKPVTNRHPVEGRVNVDNANIRQVGSTGESIKKDGNFLMAHLVITDQKALDDIEEGRQELSPGYTVQLVIAPGVFNGENFDAIQTNRTYNHLAVVDSARGGADIRLKLDDAGCTGYGEIKEDSTKLKPGENTMPKIRLDSIDYEAAQEVINHVAKIKTEADESEKALKVKTDELEKITAERDTTKEELEKLKKVDHAKEIQDAVKARVGLERLAEVVLDDIDKLDEKDNRQIKVDIISKKLPETAKRLMKKQLMSI